MASTSLGIRLDTDSRSILSAGRAFDNMGRAINNVQGRVNRLTNTFKKLSSFKLPFIGGALSGAGMGLFIKQTATFADRLAKTADAAGITIERLQELRYAGQRTGLSIEDMDRAVKAFANRMGAIANGIGGPALKSFTALGVEVRDSSGAMRDTQAIMDEVINKIGSLGSQAEKTAYLTRIFGDEAGKKMTVLLKDGADAVDDLSEKANRLGIVLSEETVRKAESFNDALDDMTAVFSTQLKSAVMSFLPDITEFMTRMTEGGKVKAFADETAELATQLFEVGKGGAKAVSWVGQFVKAIGDAGADFGDTVFKTIKGRQNIRMDQQRSRDSAILGEDYIDPHAPRLTYEQAVANALKGTKDESIWDLGMKGYGAETRTPTQTDYSPTGDSAESPTVYESPTGDSSLRREQEQLELAGARAIAREIEELERARYDRRVANAESEKQRLTLDYEFRMSLLDKELEAFKGTEEQKAEFSRLIAERKFEASGQLMDDLGQTGAESDDMLKDMAESGVAKLENAFVSLAQTGKMSFSGMITAMLSDLSRLAASKAFSSVLNHIIPVKAETTTTTTGSARGNVISRHTIFPLANGMGIAGESGSEGILPLKRNRNGDLGVVVSGGQGGQNSFNNTINIQYGGTPQENPMLIKQIQNAVRQQMETSARGVIGQQQRGYV